MHLPASCVHVWIRKPMLGLRGKCTCYTRNVLLLLLLLVKMGMMIIMSERSSSSDTGSASLVSSYVLQCRIRQLT